MGSEGDSSESDSSASKDRSPRPLKQLNVRVDLDLHQWLVKWTKKCRTTEGETIAKLLNLLRSLGHEQAEPTDRQLALVHRQEFFDANQSTAGLAWANHAAKNQQWARAIEAYHEVLKFATTRNQLDIVAYSQYEQGFCWVHMAWALRGEALSQADGAMRARYFKAAGNALETSIKFNKTYLATDTKHVKYGTRVVMFNIACACALKAQFCVEEALCNHRIGRSEIRLMLAKENKSELEALWAKVLGPKWRDLVRDEKIVESVGKANAEALKWLNQIPEGGESTLPRSFHFLVGLADLDQDLMFFRSDPMFRESFRGWVNSNSTVEVLWKSYRDLKEQLNERLEAD